LIEAGDNSAIADAVKAIKKNLLGLLEVIKDGRCMFDSFACSRHKTL
jgi:hypothetical protein